MCVAGCKGAVVMNFIKVSSSRSRCCVGVSGSTAPSTSGVPFYLSLPRPLPSLGLEVVTQPSSLIGLQRSVRFGVAGWVDRGKG